jgi:3-methyladenine DNA glycosylase/8-oxoguanine DNA glycosylase
MRLDRPEILEHLRAADPKLRGVIDAVGPCKLRIDRMQSPYETLFESILHQQLTGKAARTILGRVKAAFGDGVIPAPASIVAADDAVLRGAGLSRAKTAAIKDLAARTLGGHVPPLPALRRMDDAAIVEHLTQIRGVGPWTVEMMLIFRLGRPDVLPVHDYGVRNGFRIAHGRRELPTPTALARAGERWRPWRTVASWYLWRAVDLSRLPTSRID